MTFKELLSKQEFIFTDGAMGTMLQAEDLDMGAIPEELNLDSPELIRNIHKQYINAGAQIVYTNTFGANSYKLKHSKYSLEQVITSGIALAKQAAAGTDTLIAQDIGPIGQLLEPSGTLTFDQAYAVYKEQVLLGEDSDLIVLETMTDLYELKAAVLAAKENSSRPVVCTMSFEQNRRTFAGVSIPCMALTLEGLGADAIGINCSLGPKEFYPIAEELCRWTTLPVIAKPNAGLPDPVTNTYTVFPEEFALEMEKLTGLGVKLFGGCCGTTPEYIRVLKQKLKQKTGPKKQPSPQNSFSICSGNTVVTVSEPKIIGERINPTGKKMFKQALIENNMDYILNQAVSQVKCGADILDVNVGLPEIDEKQTMVQTIKALQGIVDVPLQIDSTKAEVLEAGLRYYNGKPIVNSVNGEDESLDTILPLVKKYGAAVVGLTLDKNGIPKTAQERFAIAEKIVNRAEQLGIHRHDVYIDCLTLTASAEQEGVKETLHALAMVKQRLGCKTVLGVSNISFGLPNRELINQTFLTMALENGLDLPIINPNAEAMTNAVKAYKVLAGIDKNSAAYIHAFNRETSTSQTAANISREQAPSLDYAIENGLKQQCAELTKTLLALHEPMEIVNTILIPALDRAGTLFEQGKTFLPQLIQSAEAAQRCFEVIKQNIAASNAAPISKGKIILATVKGDIHDIGKNIVKVLLENYGYTVVDLGKDVDPQRVADTAAEQNIKLVGLSALMTTTLKSMEDTIRLIHTDARLNQTDSNGLIIPNTCQCTVFVGGAVLTKEYAAAIGADFYCKDAKEGVDVAKKIFR